jgi:hypothetical protein
LECIYEELLRKRLAAGLDLGAKRSLQLIETISRAETPFSLHVFGGAISVPLAVSYLILIPKAIRRKINKCRALCAQM